MRPVAESGRGRGFFLAPLKDIQFDEDECDEPQERVPEVDEIALDTPVDCCAKSLGARVFATVGSEDKRKLCEELGADVVVNYSQHDFAEVVMEETANKGVDVVFDNVGAAVMEKSMSCIAYHGRYLMMGFASDKTRADQPLVVPRMADKTPPQADWVRDNDAEI